MRHRHAFPLNRALPALALTCLPAGCAGAPSITVAGAYFPAWLACALVAVAGAIVARIAMVATGLAGTLPLQLSVCVALGSLCGLALWAAWVGA